MGCWKIFNVTREFRKARLGCLFAAAFSMGGTFLHAGDAFGATYFEAQTGSNNNPGTEAAPWATISKANQTLRLGDTVTILEGTYSDYIEPAFSGAAGQPIVYKAQSGNRVVVTSRMRLAGRSYITVQGIRFESSGRNWYQDDQNAHHIELIDCEFDQSQRGTTFVGILVDASYMTIRGCRIERWHAGDAIRLRRDHALIEDNDFSDTKAGHGVVIPEDSYMIVRRNYFHNAWDRAMSVVWRQTGEPCENVLIEDNIIFDCNWDGQAPIPFRQPGDEPDGADQVVKLDCSRAIFRNNVVACSNRGKDYDYMGQLDMNSYGSLATNNLTIHHEHLRIYHNTIYSNTHSAIRMKRNPEYDAVAKDEDNVVKNNIIAQHDQYAMRIEGNTPLQTYRVENNLFLQNVLHDGEWSVAQMEGRFPGVFAQNMTGMPVFPDPARIALAQQQNTPVRWDDFVLMPGSPGKRQGVALTRVAASVTNASAVPVEDALYFFDGFGMVEGDEITIVGSSSTVRTKVIQRMDDVTLNVSPPVTVSQGDRVYLTRYGTSPDLGAVGNSRFGTADFVPGDANGDGGFDLADVNQVIKWIAGLELFPAVGDLRWMGADVNCDGEVDLADVNWMIKVLQGIAPFPC